MCIRDSIKGDGDDAAAVRAFCARAVSDLAAAGVRARVDDRDKMRPGAKYFEWERKGVPLRIEIGPRDLAAGAAVAKRRAGAGADEKVPLPLAADADGGAPALDVAQVVAMLDELQAQLLATARERLERKTVRVDAYDDMVAALEGNAKRGAPSAAGGAADDADDIDGLGDSDAGSFFLVPWKARPPRLALRASRRARARARLSLIHI